MCAYSLLFTFSMLGCLTAAPVGTLYAKDLSISVTRAAVPLGSRLPLTVTGGIEPYTFNVSAGSMSGSEFIAPLSLDASLNESLVSIQVRDQDGRNATQNVWVYRPGTLDKTFGSSGIATHGTATLQKVFVDSRSKIYAKTDAGFQIRVHRFSPSGALDTEFATAGSQTLNPGFTPSDAYVHQFHETTQGEIGVVGSAWSGSPDYSHLAFRFLSSGSLDPSYASGAGFYSDSVNSGNVGYALRDEADRVYLFGNTGMMSTQHRVTRLDAHGNLDTSYASGGFTTFTTLGGTYNTLDGAILRSDGSLLVSGVARDPGGIYQSILGAILSNGTVDPAFTPAAIIPPGLLGTYSGGKDLLMRPDGKFYWFVSDWQAGDHIHLSRRNADGTADTDWATNGWRNPLAGTLARAHLDYESRIIVCGMNGAGARVARLIQNGSLDTSFATDGLFNATDFPSASGFTVGDCAVDELGRIVLTGSRAGAGYMIRIWN